jgi:hypothetical protein
MIKDGVDSLRSAGNTALWVMAWFGLTAAAQAQPRHLFLDPAFVRESRGTELVANPPRSEEVVIRPDRPWETGPLKFTFYLTVLDENGKLRLWYVCRDAAKVTDLAYAESVDGVHWTKPELGIVDYHGSRANNLLGIHRQEGSVFRDPNPKSEDERYVYVSTVFKSGGIYRYTSPDGLRWKRDAEPFLPFEADSQNVTFWDTKLKRYVSYIRGWNISKPFGFGRKVVRLESDRLDRPSGIVPKGNQGRVFPKEPDRDPLIVDEIPDTFVYDERDPKDTDIYTNAIQPYPADPSWYVGFPALLRHNYASPNRSDGWTEIQFIGSHDGKIWHRYNRPTYAGLGLAGSDTTGMVYMGPGLVVRGDEIWQYGTGFRTTHGDEPGRAKQGDGVILRYVHRLDGFVSLDFAQTGGRAVCAPVNVTGNKLLLNLDTGALGGLQVGLRTATGELVPGFGVEDCELLVVNSTKAVVTWHGRSDLAALRGREVQVEVSGSRAKLYSLRFE